MSRIGKRLRIEKTGGMMSIRALTLSVAIAIATVIFAAPANGEAQSIHKSALNVSPTDVQTVLKTNQTVFQAPVKYQTSSLRKRVVLGAVLGTIGGMVAGIPLYRYCSNEGGSKCGGIPLYFGAIGAGVGVAVALR